MHPKETALEEISEVTAKEDINKIDRDSEEEGMAAEDMAVGAEKETMMKRIGMVGRAEEDGRIVAEAKEEAITDSYKILRFLQPNLL